MGVGNVVLMMGIMSFLWLLVPRRLQFPKCFKILVDSNSLIIMVIVILVAFFAISLHCDIDFALLFSLFIYVVCDLRFDGGFVFDGRIGGVGCLIGVGLRLWCVSEGDFAGG